MRSGTLHTVSLQTPRPVHWQPVRIKQRTNLAGRCHVYWQWDGSQTMSTRGMGTTQLQSLAGCFYPFGGKLCHSKCLSQKDFVPLQIFLEETFLEIYFHPQAIYFISSHQLLLSRLVPFRCCSRCLKQTYFQQTPNQRVLVELLNLNSAVCDSQRYCDNN